MYKRPLSILLTLVMVFSMTACGVSDTDTDTHTQPSTASATVEATASTTDETRDSSWRNSNYIDRKKIERLDYTILREMTAEETSEVMKVMVDLSSTPLSLDEMGNMASNFLDLCCYSNINVNDYYFYSAKAFDNVYAQAIEQGIPLEQLSLWTSIPSVDVLLKYFNSEFTSVENIGCNALYMPLYLLEKDDAILVAETIFSNPASFENSANMLYDATQCPYPEVQNMGLSALISISKTSQPRDASSTHELCGIFASKVVINDVLTKEKLTEVWENILENPNYDFVAKYSTMYNAGDEPLCSEVLYRLIEMAKDADSHTADLIRQVANELHDEDASNGLLDVLEFYSK